VFAALKAKQGNVFDISILMCGQHPTGPHAVVAGTYVLPALASKYIKESLIPSGLGMAHVTHVSGESVGITLATPDHELVSIIKFFIHIFQVSIGPIPKGMQLIFSDLCFLFH
jgi:hypothetical protein